MKPKPYTYLIKFKPTGQLYYGSRFKNVRLGLTPEEDLMLHYTTSSNTINDLINEHGLDAFEWEVRRTFSTPEQAASWETRVLKRCKVLENKKWLNGNIAGYIVPTEESRKKISDFHKDKPKTEEHKKNLSKSQKGSKRPWASKNLPKDTTGENNGMFGKHHSDETKAKIGALLSERIKGDNNPMRKVEWTEERRKTMGDKSRGKKRPQHAIDSASGKLRGKKRLKLYCEHCKRDVAIGWYNRHGNNCKSKEGTQ